MARRSFIFCDICNPLAIRNIEMRRNSSRDVRTGRRNIDGRMWFDGTDEEAAHEGWVATQDNQHICPTCFERMKAMRHVLDEHMFVSAAVAKTLHEDLD